MGWRLELQRLLLPPELQIWSLSLRCAPVLRLPRCSPAPAPLHGHAPSSSRSGNSAQPRPDAPASACSGVRIVARLKASTTLVAAPLRQLGAAASRRLDAPASARSGSSAPWRPRRRSGHGLVDSRCCASTPVLIWFSFSLI